MIEYLLINIKMMQDIQLQKLFIPMRQFITILSPLIQTYQVSVK